MSYTFLLYSNTLTGLQVLSLNRERRVGSHGLVANGLPASGRVVPSTYRAGVLGECEYRLVLR